MMTASIRPLSFLPTIKCSNCGVEIEISMMGDHACAQDSSLRHSGDSPTDFASRSRNDPGTSKSGRGTLPRIDAAAANSRYARVDQLAPNDSNQNSRSLSPLSPKSTRSSRFRMPGRSASSPLRARPPSPELMLPMDCPFPPFPTAKSRNGSRSGTPTSDSDRVHSLPENNRNTSKAVEQAPIFAPQSPRNNGSRSVLQRMNTIVPGPFNIKFRAEKDRFDQQSGHRRGITKSSIKDGSSGHIQRPSTVGSETSHKLSFSSVSSSSYALPERGVPATPSLPLGPPPLRPARPDENLVVDISPTLPASEASKELLRQDQRAQTFPLEKQAQATTRIPAESATKARIRRPTVSAANRPLHEIGSTSSFKPQKSVSDRIPSPTASSAHEHSPKSSTRQTSSAGHSASGNDVGSDGVPQRSYSSRIGSYEYGNPHHTPTESLSSNGSSGSDAKSGSSRSSPPLSDAFYKLRRRPSDTSRLDKLTTDIQSSMQDPPIEGQQSPLHQGPPPSFSRPLYARGLEASPRSPQSTQPPESPMDPTFQQRRLSPVRPPSSRLKTAPGALQSTSSNPLQTQAVPSQSPPTQRTGTRNKGKCRGCEEQIVGKSVSSADGRLTGRYHKQCFVCKTCKAPFQTADFYVINNHPYCEQHYHQLNGSLCKACDRGIEGQYLEAELKQKYHPVCFTCQDCHKALRDDYFEMSGRIYCEQHAFRAAQQTSMLGPGRRHPERRTTRLMMM